MLSVDFGVFPVLVSGNVTLRQLTGSDARSFYQLRSDPEVMRYLGRPLARSEEEMHEFIGRINRGFELNESIGWAVTIAGHPLMIGAIGFHKIDKEHHRAEVGYQLLPAFQRRGIMSRALGLALDFGFRAIGLHSVEANVDELNTASIALLLKHGFVQEAYFKENFYFEGKFLNSVIYSLLAPEERNSSNAFE